MDRTRIIPCHPLGTETGNPRVEPRILVGVTCGTWTKANALTTSPREPVVVTLPARLPRPASYPRMMSMEKVSVFVPPADPEACTAPLPLMIGHSQRVAKAGEPPRHERDLKHGLPLARSAPVLCSAAVFRFAFPKRRCFHDQPRALSHPLAGITVS